VAHHLTDIYNTSTVTQAITIFEACDRIGGRVDTQHNVRGSQTSLDWAAGHFHDEDRCFIDVSIANSLD